MDLFTNIPSPPFTHQPPLPSLSPPLARTSISTTLPYSLVLLLLPSFFSSLLILRESDTMKRKSLRREQFLPYP